MKKQQIHARLIERETNFRRWAIANGYEPRTVTQVVNRWCGRKDFPRGRMSYRILRDLSREIGREVVPGILAEVA